MSETAHGNIILTGGGRLTVDTVLQMGYWPNDVGVIDVNGGTVHTGSDCYVGGTRGHGTINLRSGEFYCGGWLILGSDVLDGVGKVNLIGGKLKVVGDFPISLNSNIDITGGELILLAQAFAGNDMRPEIKDFVDAGQITAYGGKGTVKVVCDANVTGDNYAHVTAEIAQTCQNGIYLQGDIDQNCVVDFRDFALIARDWLRCNEATKPDCWAF
jgi:hypothetical protein